MHDQFLTALLSTAFLVAVLACLVGICLSFQTSFSQKMCVD